MAANNDIELSVVTLRTKKMFLADCLKKHKELAKFQREYKQVLSTRLKSRSDSLFEKSYAQTIESLRNERNDLRAQIWVAKSRSNKREDQRLLKQIQCHIKCQDRLSEQIKKLKSNVNNLERQMGVVDKQIYELNQKTVADTQHQNYVNRTRKKMAVLENTLEIGVRRECKFTALNAALREEIKLLLAEREHFCLIYENYMKNLNTDKKYLLDLLEYASNTYDGSISVMEKINKRGIFSKETEQTKINVEAVMRNFAATREVQNFVACKGKSKTLADLQPKEYRRREAFKRNCVRKVNLYKHVMEDVRRFSGAVSNYSVINNYQHNESLYYTYFNYANETSFHITLLEGAVQRLYESVKKAALRTRAQNSEQIAKLKDLEAKLRERRAANEVLNSKLEAQQERLENLYEGIETIFDLCRMDSKPFLELLGNQSNVDLNNVRGRLKVFEKRILNILRFVYVKERTDLNINYEKYVVTGIERIWDYPTPLNDIVLTQQCPECAESEAFVGNAATEGGVAIASLKKVREKVCEVANQADMQYRLHSISNCRLPGSRLLVAKRNT